MNKNTFFTGQPIFSQLLSLIPSQVLGKAIKQHDSDRYYKKFKSYDHLVSMLYASFQRCTSLREVTTGLMACHHKLSHLGVSYVPRKSTLADANEKRSEALFSTIYQLLYRYHFKSLPDSRLKGNIEKRLFLIDSTTIALFSDVMKGMGEKPISGKRKGGAKAHLLVKAEEDVPCFAMITHATKNDKAILSQIQLPKGAIVVFDKGYNSYKQFKTWNQQGVTWVTRMSDVAWQTLKEKKEIIKEEQDLGIISDDKVVLGRPSNNPTPKITVRRIVFYDKETNKQFTFITNNNWFKASVIAGIYKRRWQIELLFKRLKQNYPLRYFLGETENAIKIQIWCSLITDLLLKIIQKKVTRKWSFANISGMIRLHLMNYINLLNFLNNPEKTLMFFQHKEPDFQLKLFS